MNGIKYIIEESHTHSYDIDIAKFSDFITDYPDLIVLKKQQGRWATATGFDIAKMLAAFQEKTLPPTIEDNNDDLPF